MRCEGGGSAVQPPYSGRTVVFKLTLVFQMLKVFSLFMFKAFVEAVQVSVWMGTYIENQYIQSPQTLHYFVSSVWINLCLHKLLTK